MLMARERRPAIRTLRGWAISVLQEAGAIGDVCRDAIFILMAGVPQITADLMQRRKSAAVGPGRVKRLCFL